MLWIKSKRPKLNTQADSIHTKLFTWANVFMLSVMLIYFLSFKSYKYIYAFRLFLVYSLDNDDMKSLKRHVVLISIINFLAEMFL